MWQSTSGATLTHLPLLCRGRGRWRLFFKLYNGSERLAVRFCCVYVRFYCVYVRFCCVWPVLLLSFGVRFYCACCTPLLRVVYASVARGREVRVAGLGVRFYCASLYGSMACAVRRLRG